MPEFVGALSVSSSHGSGVVHARVLHSMSIHRGPHKTAHSVTSSRAPGDLLCGVQRSGTMVESDRPITCPQCKRMAERYALERRIVGA